MIPGVAFDLAQKLEKTFRHTTRSQTEPPSGIKRDVEVYRCEEATVKTDTRDSLIGKQGIRADDANLIPKDACIVQAPENTCNDRGDPVQSHRSIYRDHIFKGLAQAAPAFFGRLFASDEGVVRSLGFSGPDAEGFLNWAVTTI